MKTFFLLFASVVITWSRDPVVVVRPDRDPTPVGGFLNTPRTRSSPEERALIRNADISSVCRDPHRRVTLNGELRSCDLTPLFKWVAAGRPGTSPMPAWTNISGTVQYSGPNYIVLNPPEIYAKYFSKSYAQPCIVKNFPHQVSDNTGLSFFAVAAGTAKHGDRTLRAYDYGEPFTPVLAKTSTNTVATFTNSPTAAAATTKRLNAVISK